MILSCIPKGKC